MSERDKDNAAFRNGKKAFWDGVPIDGNPMRAPDSRYAWTQGWLEEQKEYEARSAALAKKVADALEGQI
ncbi:MAG: hypothetical protein C4576_31805 [Desulfobacteraceae bacterium]|nr:MAG: hypothetical protein C4576_31805 [Desulfobacteraceae bacterium]